MQRRNTSFAMTALVISGVLFVGGVVLFATQLLLGANNPEDWFARVFVIGAGALFTSAALVLILQRSDWRRPARWAAVVVNFGATMFALALITNALWT